MLETSPWADEYMDKKDMLLQLKMRSNDAEEDELLKRHGVQIETVTVKGVEHSVRTWSIPKNEAEADEMDACRGETVKLRLSHLERICVAARLDELYMERMSLRMQRLIFVPGEEQERILDWFFRGWSGGRKLENER